MLQRPRRASLLLCLRGRRSGGCARDRSGARRGPGCCSRRGAGHSGSAFHRRNASLGGGSGGSGGGGGSFGGGFHLFGIARGRHNRDKRDVGSRGCLDAGRQLIS